MSIDKTKKNYNRVYMANNRETLREYRRKHYTGIYGSWYAMKQRCGNPNNKSYHNYGGRGISYPLQWETFEGFKMDMGHSYKSGLTLERIDNNSSYSLDNCRWATKKEQANNMRRNHIIVYKGESKTLSQWAEHLGLKPHTLLFRSLRGWTVERMLSARLERPWKLTPGITSNKN